LVKKEGDLLYKEKKPRIGLLGLMTEGYEPIFPGITKRQEDYAREIVDSLKGDVDIYFPKSAQNRGQIEEMIKDFNSKDLDGILIILLTYCQGAWIVRALQNNRLPIALAVVQPAQKVEDDWGELDFTVNQGIHGAQDNSNAIVRAGLKCQFFAGNRHEQKFKDFVIDFAKASQTYRYLKRMRVAVIGKMAGMADIMGDDMAFYRKIGPELIHDSAGNLYKYMQSVTKKEIDDRINIDKEIFDIDSNLKYDRHAYAVHMYLGIKKFLEERRYDAFTAHFEIFGEDGRFKQLPLLAASHLMADGFGYAAEGDSMCASMVAAAHCIGKKDGNFTEMYAMDFEKKAIVFCHAGEGNWATARKDMKPKLINRYLGEGGLDNPPTPIFTPQFGRATLTSLVSIDGSNFRLILSKGEILPITSLVHPEMPYIFYRPDTGIEQCVEGWLLNGGTHHEVINLGDVSKRWEMLSNMLDVEYIEV
jgi:L-arabinose isomerase